MFSDLATNTAAKKKAPSGGWLSGWFGKASKGETRGSAGNNTVDGNPGETRQESASDDEPKKLEHVTVPGKGKL